MRKRYIAGNWKMNTVLEDSVTLAQKIVHNSTAVSDNAHIVIAPPFTALHTIKKIVDSSTVELAAQNVSSDLSGAHTGEISASMLKSVGVTTVIIGHSERRIIYNEDDVLINKKVKVTLSQSLKVILCVGETLEEREAGKVQEVVDNQLIVGLASVDEVEMAHIVIAYEPVWAIGTGKTASPKEANDVHVMIRNRIKKLYSEDLAEKTIILYGGSVKPDNATTLLSEEHIDGALVGGAALDVELFMSIIKA